MRSPTVSEVAAAIAGLTGFAPFANELTLVTVPEPLQLFEKAYGWGEPITRLGFSTIRAHTPVFGGFGHPELPGASGWKASPFNP